MQVIDLRSEDPLYILSTMRFILQQFSQYNIVLFLTFYQPLYWNSRARLYYYLWSCPFDETIDICVNQLFENTETVEGFTKSELKQLLCLATKGFI